MVGSDHAGHAPACQHGGQHAGTGTNIKHHQVGARGQRGACHQVYIFTTHGGKHTVVRVNAVVGGHTQSRYFHSLFAPFVRADHAQQVAQAGHAGTILRPHRAPGFGAGLARIGCAAQGDAVVGVEGQQHHGQHACPLRLRLAVQVKTVGRRHGRLVDGRTFGRTLFALGRFVDAPGQRLQQLAGVLKIAAPKQGRAFAGQVVGVIGRGGVIGQHHAFGWRGATLGAPQRRTGLARFGPVNVRRLHERGGGLRGCGAQLVYAW